MKNLLLLLTILFFLPSCISNKKHKAAIDLIKNQHVTEVAKLNNEISDRDEKIYGLELSLSERIGENNILLMLRDELQAEVEKLESNIENLSSSSSSTASTLRADLADRERKIKTLKQLLSEVDQTLTQHGEVIKEMTGALNFLAQDYPEQIDVSFGYDFAKFNIVESFLFKKNSTTRLHDEGYSFLEKFADIFQQYPNVKVQVVGHTDTDPPRDKKRYADNWNFSALQSATIVRTIVDDFDVSTNQITLSAKAEFAPRGSNATTDGKLKNRRIEFLIALDSEDLADKVRKVVEKADLN